MANYNVNEVITILRAKGFSTDITGIDYDNGIYDIVISKYGASITLEYRPYVEDPNLFCYRIFDSWAYRYTNRYAIPEIKKVIFNDPATIVIWKDKTKTVVKCSKNDILDPEKGLAMAITKKAMGNKNNYYREIKKWTADKPKVIDSPTAEVIMHDLAQHAYRALINTLHDKKATKADLGVAMEEAVGYLGQLLDD